MGENGQGEVSPPEWTGKHWLKSNYGIGLIIVDIILTVIIMLLLFFISGTNGDLSGASFSVTRLNILLFAILGALGYVFTPLFKDIDRSIGTVLEYNFRIPGAIPLGFGVFLLSDYLLQNGGIGVLGLSFLTGLYVNIFYKRLGAIADWALPSEDTTDEEEATEQLESDDEATEQTDDENN